MANLQDRIGTTRAYGTVTSEHTVKVKAKFRTRLSGAIQIKVVERYPRKLCASIAGAGGG